MQIVSNFLNKKINLLIKFIFSKFNSIAISEFIFKQVITNRSKNYPRPIRFKYRQILSAIPPYNPLGQNQNAVPDVELMIAVAQKDFDVLDLSIDSALRNVQNQIKKITLVCPDSYVDNLLCRYEAYDVVGENSLISSNLEKLLSNFVQPDRQGWVRQQFLKKMFVLRCLMPVLVLDADTILLKPKTWIRSDGKQILSISDEYHPPYSEQFLKFSGLHTSPWSFVTHHQLMQPRVVREYLNESDDSFERYLKSANRHEASSISEYHSYGTWMLNKHPDMFIYSKWMNQSVPKNVGLSLNIFEIKERFPRACSISLHDYLN